LTTKNGGGSEIVEGVISSNEWYDPFVQTVISVLDGYHSITGLPWWIVIASSTLALRMALLPLLVFQLQKMKKFAELMPKLPPPFPPPLSGKSYIKQYLFFRKEKQAIGCPSALWGLASISVQVPCFLLWMTSVRKMSMDHYPGFDCGGMLWFQNLTETPHGAWAPIFPILIAGLHFTNVQISFRMASDGKVTGILSLLAKYYKHYLDILTVPICLIGFCVPQGSLVYWLTNSSFTVVQQLSLNHPPICQKLGLPDKSTIKNEETTGTRIPETRSSGAGMECNSMKNEETATGTHEIIFSKEGMERRVSAHNLSPDELVPLSIQLLAKGNKDKAILLLRLALKKDPEYVTAMVVLGQALLGKEMLTEALECFEGAISKLLHVGHPTKDEEVDLLNIASQWAGSICIRQGKDAAGLEHLQRVAHLREPDDPKGKAHYIDGLVLLASALFRDGQKDEAAKHLRKAVAYNYDAYHEFLQQCLEDSDNVHATGDRKNP
ncbi:Albino3-like protein 3 protein, partial [Thalictrum thalictroides]